MADVFFSLVLIEKGVLSFPLLTLANGHFLLGTACPQNPGSI
jgi:hypothetical protein